MKAFPSREKVELANTFAIYGMDLRDYFAARALQGYMSKFGGYVLQDKKHYAIKFYEIADAMMEARK